MRMSDWSSDVCSSDLLCRLVVDDLAEHRGHRLALVEPLAAELGERLGRLLLVERYEAGHPTIGKIFMIERVEDARTADIRETQDRQRPQMLVTKHRLKAARQRRVGEEAVEIHRSFGHRDGMAVRRDGAVEIGQRLAVTQRTHLDRKSTRLNSSH